MVLAEWLVGLAGERLRDALHLVFIGGLAALIAWQFLNEPATRWSGPSVDGLALLALLAGGAAAVAYQRFAPVRSWLTVLSFSPLLVLMLFLVFSPMRPLVVAGEGPRPEKAASNGTPVVMLLLDELPTASLMDSGGRIDRGLYPGFAALTQDATWYRNAASVGDYTQLAVPALLTGRSVAYGSPPIATEHPRNLFSLLGGSYRLDVSEAETDMCRKSVCATQEVEPFGRRTRRLVSEVLGGVPALPRAVGDRLADLTAVEEGVAPGPPRRFGGSVRRLAHDSQPQRFESFLHTLAPSSRRTLNFLHLVLPHQPWFYLPSGQAYESAHKISTSQIGGWPRDPRVPAIAWQRHLMQVQYVDRMVARLVRRLKQIGLYDRALVVVTADHGVAFRPGDQARLVTRTNVGQVAPVPLLVKAPGQRAGRVDDGFVETTDVLPTIARHAGSAADLAAPGGAGG